MTAAATAANRGVPKVRVLFGTERFSSRHSWSELTALMSGPLLTRELDVAHDGDSPAAERIDREKCFMVVVIELHHAAELTLGRVGARQRSGRRGASVVRWSPDHAVVPRPFSRRWASRACLG